MSLFAKVRGVAAEEGVLAQAGGGVCPHRHRHWGHFLQARDPLSAPLRPPPLGGARLPFSWFLGRGT